MTNHNFNTLDERDKSPTMGDPEGNDVSLQDTLYRTIFRFCIKKFEKRFIKYWGIISAFSSAYEQWVAEKPKDPDSTDSTADSLRCLPNFTMPSR
jgi:hypothetical protein